jgi:glycosyltransferase A (GT-A) superfamily protein (DUF2064 family)
MNPAIKTVVVIAKAPYPGRVKTRLVGPVTAHQAAELAAAALSDTLRRLEEFRCVRRVLLLDGEPAGWLRPLWQVMPQADGTLDERLASGFESLPPGPAVVVGMDTPQLNAENLTFDPSRFDACLGPATDGGYWAIGFRDPSMAAAVIRGVPMSTVGTGAEQQRRMTEAGLRVQLLPMLTDIDTPQAAAVVAASHPDTGFARCWRALRRAAVT